MPGFGQVIRQLFLGRDEPSRASRSNEASRLDAGATPVPADSQEIVSMARDFRRFLDQQDERQQELGRVMSALPQSMGALPELVRQQTRLADLVAQQLMYARQRDEQVEKTLARITQGVEQQRDVMSLVQQQLDLNHESAVQVAQGVTTLARAVEQLQSTSDRSTSALQGLLEKTTERDAGLQKQYASVQNWLLFVVILAFGTLAAGVILMWVALEIRAAPALPAAVAPAPVAPDTPLVTGPDVPDAGAASARPAPTTLPALGGAPEPLKQDPPPATGGAPTPPRL